MFDNKGERESLDGDKTRIRIPNSQHQFPSKPRGNFAPVFVSHLTFFLIISYE